MPACKRSYVFFGLPLIIATWFLGAAALGGSQTARVQTQMQQMASRAAASPIKLDLQTDSGSATLGSKVSLRVSMLNADNQPATWDHPCTVNFEITFASKKVERDAVIIPKGQSSAATTFVASEYGLAHLRVAESTDSLSPAGNTVFIVNPVSKQGKTRTKKQTSKGTSLHEFRAVPRARARLIFASYPASVSSEAHLAEQQVPDVAPAAAVLPTAPPETPQLLLVNSTGKDEILADGKDFARVRVYYMSPNGKGAPNDIRLWMTWSNGKFYPQPMIIHQGEFDAEGKLISSSPVEASVSLISSAPHIPVQGSSTLKISFAPPIYGFGPATSETVLKLCLIDREPLVGCFFDDQGRCIQTDRKRHVNVSSTNPSLHVAPDSFDVLANDGTATIFLQPTWRGTASLEMWTPGHAKQRIAVEVSIWLVVTLCLIGGAIGGIAAKDKLKGSIWWRIFIGIVAAIVLVWLCVYAVIPQSSSVIAHSLISVLVVGIVGGYAGTHVLDFAAKKLGVLT